MIIFKKVLSVGIYSFVYGNIVLKKEGALKPVYISTKAKPNGSLCY
jgi:hypothetical protein